MSIGVAILLSALIFAGILLYWITKDRWDWKRGRRRFSIAVGSLVIAICLGLAGIWGYQKYDGLPRRQTTYADLTLGMKMYDVKYVKGYPPDVFGPPETKGEDAGSQPVIETKDFKTALKPEQYFEWEYPIGDQGSYLVAHFDSKTKSLKAIGCYATAVDDCSPLLGIVYGDTEEEIARKLGKPSDQWIATDSGTKKMNYNDLNVRFYLTRKKAYMFEVFKSD